MAAKPDCWWVVFVDNGFSWLSAWSRVPFGPGPCAAPNAEAARAHHDARHPDRLAVTVKREAVLEGEELEWTKVKFCAKCRGPIAEPVLGDDPFERCEWCADPE
jgi:hypothetical protein